MKHNIFGQVNMNCSNRWSLALHFSLISFVLLPLWHRHLHRCLSSQPIHFLFQFPKLKFLFLLRLFSISIENCWSHCHHYYSRYCCYLVCAQVGWFKRFTFNTFQMFRISAFCAFETMHRKFIRLNVEPKMLKVPLTSRAQPDSSICVCERLQKVSRLFSFLCWPKWKCTAMM